MARQLTPKQESFIRTYLETSNASEAYRRVYDVSETTKATTIVVKASELMANPMVAARLAELQERAAEKALVTVASITAELNEARDLARQLENPTAMTTAVMGKAKVNGLLVDKVDTKVAFNAVIQGDDADV